MQKSVAVILSVLLLVSGAVAAYGECFEATIHGDFGAGDENKDHEDPSIHCPDALLTSQIQAAPMTRSDRRILNKVLPVIGEKLGSSVLVARFKNHYFRPPISQQDLFRHEEVYRL